MAIVTIPYFEDNYAFLAVNGSRSILFDCGDGTAIANHLDRIGIVPNVLLLTHNHHDHVDGVRELSSRFPMIKIYPAGYFSEFVQFEEIPVEQIFTPGHTLDSYCYYLPNQSALITGDTLFAGGCGRCFSGQHDLFCDSLGKITGLPAETKFYPAHEYLNANMKFLKSRGIECSFYEQRVANEPFPSTGITLAEELQHNPFLQAGKLKNPTLFRELRTQKDHFSS